MSKTQHTPGPWIAGTTFYGATDMGKPNVRHGDTSNVMCWLNISGAYGGNGGLDRANADARLIAAAPELLEALILCRSELFALKDGSVGGIPNSIAALIPERLELARAAIASATGEA